MEGFTKNVNWNKSQVVSCNTNLKASQVLRRDFYEKFMEWFLWEEIFGALHRKFKKPNWYDTLLELLTNLSNFDLILLTFFTKIPKWKLEAFVFLVTFWFSVVSSVGWVGLLEDSSEGKGDEEVTVALVELGLELDPVQPVEEPKQIVLNNKNKLNVLFDKFQNGILVGNIFPLLSSRLVSQISYF